MISLTSAFVKPGEPRHPAPPLPDDDAQRFDLVAKRLYTPVIGDVLDALGRTHQFLPPEIRPLQPEMVVVGRAMPVVVAAVYGPQAQPFGRLTEALDQLSPGDVWVADGGGVSCAAWGEILTATARIRGAAGAVLHGYHRDTPKVLAQGWPVFSHGPYAQDAAVRSIVIDVRVRIEIDGVAVEPGDLIVGDVDGVVVVPRALEDEVLERALEKASAENVVLGAIESGLSSTEAFARYGVL
jgi:4-hydroxy-4-methyl-2-oxoglutarate aldolase